MSQWQAFSRRYRIYARLHQQRLERLTRQSIEVIQAFYQARGDTMMLSFSAGKDSILMHSLVSQAQVPVKTVWFARPSLPPTLQMVQQFSALKVHLHQNGTFERDHGSEPQWSKRPKMNAEINDYRELDRLWHISGTFVGIRRNESLKRRYALTKITAEAKSYSGGWRCAPIAAWSTDDVWAYTINSGLPINQQYIDLIEAGAPEDILRVSSIGALFSSDLPADQSRLFLQKLYPQAFAEFLEDNPNINV